MSKEFHFIHLTPWLTPIPNMNVSCVYRIRFGRHYYIGRTKCLRKRMKCHEADLNRYFTTWRFDDDTDTYYRKVLNYLALPTSSFGGFYEVLEECEGEEERVLAEQKWLDKCIDDPLCLNVGFVAHPYVYRPKKSKFKNDDVE